MDTKNLVCVYLLLAVCLLLGSGCPCLCIPCKPESTFLKTNGKQIKDNYGTGTAVSLRGINLGGWLVQEPWMCNTGEGVVDEYTLRHTLAARFDQDKMWDLLNAYRDAYLQEADFRNIKDAGMNVVRIPINYMDYMDFDGTMRTSVPGQTSIWSRLDWAVEQAGKRGIYSIIDLHAAQGSQNGFDNSGQAGTAYFWYENTLGATCRANMITLWENIADHYKDNPAVAAYDLLNEPQGSYGHDGDAGDKSTWYNQAYKAIRSIDPDHIIIMEAPWHFGPENICSPSDYNWTNVIYEIHCYEWTNQDWNGMNNYINTTLAEMITWANNYNIPIFNGEFQVYGFMDLWTQYLTGMNNAGIPWTAWTYKVTGSGSSWGVLYNSFSGTYPDINNDSYQKILEDWQTCDTTTHYKYNGTLGPVVTSLTGVNKGISLWN